MPTKGATQVQNKNKEPTKDKEGRKEGNVESPTGISENHNENEEERLIPEEEWNGWERVQRHKNPVKSKYPNRGTR